MKMKVWGLRLAGSVLCLLAFTGFAVSAFGEAAVEARPLQGIPVEAYGVTGFRADYEGTLAITPAARDPGIAEGRGHSRITRQGGGNPFDPDWVERHVEFVAFRCHQNPQETDANAAFFPGILGSRYARVVRVLDDRNLIVDFEFNGGSLAEPRVGTNASGYFFIDCAPALRRMVQAPERPETFVFKAGVNYVCKGMPNIPFLAAAQTGDMRWVSSEPGKRAVIKLSAEDAYELRSGAFFKLDAHDHSIFLRDIDIIGPTYTVPTVQGGWGGVMFDYARGECARTLEIRNSNTFAEKEAVERRKAPLPAGATWLAPGLTGIVGGGGRKGDRGDGVIDIIGYQRFNLVNATWISRCLHSIKNNDGAGNWILIDGESVGPDGIPVNRVYEATYVKRNRFSGVLLSFHHFDGAGAKRGVRIEEGTFSWPMLENQYWTGGTSESSTEPCRIEVDGLELYFGNNGDWRRESGNRKASPAIVSARDALLFDRIPEPGDRIPLTAVASNRFRVWGWGVQVGDVLEQGGSGFEIASRTREAMTGETNGVPGIGPGSAHVWSVSFKDGRGPQGTNVEAVVRTSRSAALLDGRPRRADAVYERDLNGHWQYNRAEVNYQFRNICFSGNYRQTDGPARNGPDYEGLWELPVTQEWVNCWAMETDGCAPGIPAREIRSEAFGKRVLQLRNTHPDSRKRDHHVLVDGGWLTAQRMNDRASPLWIRNRPTLIYGTASYGEPRLCNPVMLDRKGVVIPQQGLSVSLVGGYKLDLSRSVFGSASDTMPVTLNVYGDGTLILDEVRFNTVTRGTNQVSGGVVTALANGLEKAPFRLHLKGRNGAGAFRLQGDPVDGSLLLSGWTLGHPPYSRERLPISPGWKAIPGFDRKVSIE